MVNDCYVRDYGTRNELASMQPIPPDSRHPPSGAGDRRPQSGPPPPAGLRPY